MALYAFSSFFIRAQHSPQPRIFRYRTEIGDLEPSAVIVFRRCVVVGVWAEAVIGLVQPFHLPIFSIQPYGNG